MAIGGSVDGRNSVLPPYARSVFAVALPRWRYGDECVPGPLRIASWPASARLRDWREKRTSDAHGWLIRRPLPFRTGCSPAASSTKWDRRDRRGKEMVSGGTDLPAVARRTRPEPSTMVPLHRPHPTASDRSCNLNASLRPCMPRGGEASARPGGRGSSISYRFAFRTCHRSIDKKAR